MSTAFRAAPQPAPDEPAERAGGPRAILAANVDLARQTFVKTGSGIRRVSDRIRFVLAPPTQRLRAWASPKVALITPTGWTAVAVIVAGLVLGIGFGWVELFAVAVTLLGCLLLGIASVLGRLSYQVRVSLASSRVVVGERAVGELTVRNTSTRSAAPSLIELPVGRALASLPVPRLDPEAEHEELFTIPTQRRAVLRLGPVRSVRRDPLRLLSRQVNWTEPEEIYVHPRTVRLANASTGFVRDLEGLPTRDLSNDDVSFHALREYVPGDDLRYVHWRSTARVGKLMIRQFEETRRSQVMIVVSTLPADYADDDEFELGISVAASLAVAALLDGKEVAVYTSDARLPSLTPPRLLDGFSAVLPSTTRVSFADRVRQVSSDNPGASVIALVTGAQVAITDLQLATLRVPLMARCYAVRAAHAEALGRKALGEVAVVTVPQLDDLPLAIRAVA